MPRRHTILVVDDEADVVQSVQDLLRRDYHVLGTTRPQEALRILREQETHVVMSDQRMPGMSGVELLRQVREQWPLVVRLLFTGYADLKAVIDAINQGNVYRYITKPWEPDELPVIIRQAAEQHDLLAERQQLLEELRIKNQELARANAELRETAELKDAFIKVASHELRTPLTILLGMSELALSSPAVSGDLLLWLNSIRKASERLDRLVGELIQMLLARQFERPLHRVPTDLAALVRESVEDVRPFLTRRRQELEVRLGPDLGALAIEPGKIRDSLDHLLLNAIKFTPDGGRIELTAQRTEGGGVELRVADSGAGIEPANLPHVFEAFFTRRDVSRHSSGHFEFGRRGLGLGLSLVKIFVEMHGGTVAATSELGRGSTFTIWLPATPSLAA